MNVAALELFEELIECPNLFGAQAIELEPKHPAATPSNCRVHVYDRLVRGDTELEHNSGTHRDALRVDKLGATQRQVLYDYV